MSQDNQKCPKCGKPSGYDAGNGYWEGGDLHICGQCKKNLISSFCTFFGLNGASSDDFGMTVEWMDMDRILSNVHRDYAMRLSYIVTDKQYYNRTKTVPSSILESINA